MKLTEKETSREFLNECTYKSYTLYRGTTRVILEAREQVPTVHLSLPEHVYRELKKRAEGLGIQITDLIKMYINNGIRGMAFSLAPNDGFERMDERLIYIEGKVTQISELINFLVRKVRELEERIEILEGPEIVPDIVYEERRQTSNEYSSKVGRKVTQVR